MDKEKLDELIVKETEFGIGDSVISKKMGLPSMGEVIGILTGPLFVEMHQGQIIWKVKDHVDESEYDDLTPDDCLFIVAHRRDRHMMMYKRWSDLYPKWMWEPIAYVKFGQPQRNMSFEEFSSTFTDEDDKPSAKTMEELYKREVPTTDIVAYPVGDLEKI